MKLVMTLLVRDEMDIVDTHLRYHLEAGVDAIVATDHASSDGTRELLERYVREGVLHLLHEPDGPYRQAEWVTRMARMAAELGADWVVNSDADEFWWPAGGDLKDVLSRVPVDVGFVRTFVRPFLARPGDWPFQERMTVRLAPPAVINDPLSSFKVNVRLLHRAARNVEVGRGNASVRVPGFPPTPGRCAIEVLHFPIRSLTQFRRKFLDHYETVGGGRGDHARAFRAHREGTLDALYGLISVDDAGLRRGLDAGVLVEDTRLRDAVRQLEVGSRLSFPAWTLAHEAGFAVDADGLVAGELVRLHRRLDEMAERLGAVESRRAS